MTTALIILMLLGLLCVDLRSLFTSGQKKLVWFYAVCFMASAAILVLYSLDISIHGPTQWVMNLAKALSLA